MGRSASAPFSAYFAEKTRNGLHKGPKFIGSGTKLVRMGDLFTFDRIRSEWNGYHLIQLSTAELERHVLQRGDLLFCRTSVAAQGVGKCSVVVDAAEEMVPASNLIRVRIDPNRGDPDFFHYYFTSSGGHSQLLALTRGAAVFTITGRDIGAADVPCLSLRTQRLVSAVLNRIDDLIENNRRRIALLEQMAQAIYREWFVQFRYPGHESAPIGLSGLPAGWSVSTLGDELDVLESGARPRGGVDPAERGVPSVGAENIIGLGRYKFDAERFVSEAFFDSMRRGRVQDGDVLLYKDGAHIGRHSMFRDGFPHRSCAINEHVFRLRVRSPLTQNYLYFWLDDPAVVEAIVGLNSNAAQPGLSQAKLATIELLQPAPALVLEWDRVVEPMVARLFNLAKQSQSLQTARDLLLPRLVTGAIDVSDLDFDGLLEVATA